MKRFLVILFFCQNLFAYGDNVGFGMNIGKSFGFSGTVLTKYKLSYCGFSTGMVLLGVKQPKGRYIKDVSPPAWARKIETSDYSKVFLSYHFFNNKYLKNKKTFIGFGVGICGTLSCDIYRSSATGWYYTRDRGVLYPELFLSIGLVKKINGSDLIYCSISSIYLFDLSYLFSVPI